MSILKTIEDIDRLSFLGLDRKTAIRETSLSLQLSQLEKKKVELTKRNLELKRKGFPVRKGFASNYHNWKRNKNSFSIAEKQFRDLLLKNGLLDWIHEHNIKLKDIHGKTHNYHIDFYFPLLKIAIEINPEFHKTYETVHIRDLLRKQLLKRKAHVKSYSLRVFYYRKNGKPKTCIDRKYAYQLIKILKTAKPKRETLVFWQYLDRNFNANLETRGP